MKKLLNFVVLALLSQVLVAQGGAVDVNQLKGKYASSLGINVEDIRSAEVLTIQSQHFAYIKYLKDSNRHTLAEEIIFDALGGFSGTGFTITCSGVGCAECDIEGLPNPKNVYCECKRKETSDGYCNMTKSISIGK